MTMTRPTTKAIDGYRVQPVLPLSFPYFGATIIEADFTTYPDTGWCVEAVVKIGLVKSPYTFVLTLQQALEADIIERD
jgi:hypothetical protein